MDHTILSDVEDTEIYNISSFIIVPEENPLCVLLKEWSMESLLPTLISKNIDMDSLQYLTEIELSSIFKEDLGNQARFRAKLVEWRKTNNLPNYISLNESIDTLSNSSSSHALIEKFSSLTERSISTTPTSMSPCPSSQDSSDLFDLTGFFNTSTGAKIKSMYDANIPPQFTPELRELLCTYIARHYVENNKCMISNDFRRITNQIIENFPEENADYYFRNNKYPSGTLYNKYRVISKQLKKVGYFTNTKRRRSTISTTEQSVEVLTDQEDNDANKDWLKVHNAPWETVEDKWKQSFHIRSSDQARGKDIGSVIAQWPLYRNTKGFRLVEIDFEALYPTTHAHLFKTWPEFKNKIKPIFQKRLKDKHALLLSNDLSKNEDIHHIQLCKLLHFLLKPSGKQNLNGILKKYTINDSIDSFLVEVLSASHVDEKIQLAREFATSRNIKLQPFIIFINSINPQFCVIYDDIYYSFDNFLVALDICFKIFFVFRLSYPKQSEKFWLFIQKNLYKITTKFDNLSSDIIDTLSELQK